MLEHLFGSKTRSNLLQLFFNNPAKSFFVLEISRKINVQLNAVRRELANLERIGLVVIPTDNPSPQKKFFQLNIGSSMYPELQALMLKSEFMLEQDFGKQISGLGKIEYLALTGSFVNDPSSGTDIFIVGTINKVGLKNIIKEFEKRLHREINYTVMTPAEFKYRQELTDRFLYQVLDGKKIELINATTRDKKQAIRDK